MANDLNQCNFIGRLGKDVDLRFTPSGDAVANFSIAVGWKGKSKEGVEWVNIVAFGKLGQICGDYLKKGSRIFVSGNMRTRSWEDQSGQKRYSTEIVASDMQMLDSKPSDGQQSAPQRDSQPQRDAQPAQTAAPAGYSDFEDDGDIPF